MVWWRRVREYLAAVLHAYQSFVLGLVFGVAGAIGLFVSNENGVRIAALVGVALGFLVAPYKAFQRVRDERDIARSETPVDRVALQLGYVNALSGGSWGIDNFQGPNLPGLVARAIISSADHLAREVELASDDIDEFRDAVATSPLTDWIAAAFGLGESEQSAWKLTTPCNGFEFAVAREPAVLPGGGSELSARCMLLLPRGIYGVAPKLLLDVYFRDLPREPPPGGGQSDMFTRFELAGEPFKPDLQQLVELLDVLAETLTMLAPRVLGPIVHRTWRERTKERFGRPLPLVGPNFHVRSKPRDLLGSLDLPPFPRFKEGDSSAELMAQTPARVSAYDREARLALIRRSIRQLLRSLEYRDFESYVDALALPVPPLALDAGAPSLLDPS